MYAYYSKTWDMFEHMCSLRVGRWFNVILLLPELTIITRDKDHWWDYLIPMGFRVSILMFTVEFECWGN